MEKRTEEGKRRHDLGKKIYYEKKKFKKAKAVLNAEYSPPRKQVKS